MEKWNPEAALSEHRFWLQVLGDHARFIYSSLPPQEQSEISTAKQFADVFDRLLDKSRTSLDSRSLQKLTEEARRYSTQIRAFKLHLIERHLTQKDFVMGLPPTFINHMVNEVEEYLRILSYLGKGQLPPPLHPLHHHLIWLQDAVGHAGSLNDRLDLVEKKLKKTGKDFQSAFEHFYLKAVEMAGYLRTRLKRFPALDRFNREVELEMLCFKRFLDELEEMEVNVETLGTLTPLMADHMAREECYYLSKLSEVSNVERPRCDPAAPRVKG